MGKEHYLRSMSEVHIHEFEGKSDRDCFSHKMNQCDNMNIYACGKRHTCCLNLLVKTFSQGPKLLTR